MNAPDTALMSIIESDEAATRSTLEPDFQLLSAETASAEPAAPAKKSYNAIFDRYLQCQSEISAVIQRQKYFEQGLFGDHFTDDVGMKSITDIGKKAIRALIRKAQSQFAPPGGTLEINEYDVLEATGQSGWERDYQDRRWRDRTGDEEVKLKLDLDKLWLHLESTYGGDSGKVLGLKQQAQVIVSELGLKHRPEMKRTSSYVACFRRTYSEKQDYGSHKGMYHAGFHSRETIAALCRGLQCFAEWAELDGLSISLSSARNLLGDYNHYYNLRDKVSFPGLEIVFFKDKWEWRFSHDVAEKLMLFLGEFADMSDS